MGQLLHTLLQGTSLLTELSISKNKKVKPKFRPMNGTAIALTNQIQKSIHVNDLHFTENLATVPSSYILPKGSPLEVS